MTEKVVKKLKLGPESPKDQVFSAARSFLLGFSTKNGQPQKEAH